MKSLVIYDSAYGNTAQIAQAIGDALGAYGEVTVCRVGDIQGDIQPDQLDEYDLLVVGSPTQSFRPTSALSDFLKSVPKQEFDRMQVAAFDTRIAVDEKDSAFVRFALNMGGYAASRIAKQLTRHGGVLVVPAEGFYVEGKEGPLRAGELERAAAWAKTLVAAQTPVMEPQAQAA